MNQEHYYIWKTIDKIAYINGISVSALAKKAGLDATTFNKSKRFSTYGKLRWPSMESISKVLQITGMNWHNFYIYLMEVKKENEKTVK